VIVLIGSK